MRITIFFGKDIDKGRYNSYNTILSDPRFKSDDLIIDVFDYNRNGINLDDIGIDKTDIVVLNAHGNFETKVIDGQVQKFSLMSDLLQNKRLTIDIINAINEKMHPSHFFVLGCHQGTVIHDLKRNINKFEVDTTFSVPSSSKYPVFCFEDELYIENLLSIFASGEGFNAIQTFSKQVLINPQTLFFAKISKNKFTQEKKIILIKSVGPKHIYGIQNLQNYILTPPTQNDNFKDKSQQGSIIIEGRDISYEIEELYKSFDQNKHLVLNDIKFYNLRWLFIQINRNKSDLIINFLKIQTHENLEYYFSQVILDRNILFLACDRGVASVVKYIIESKVDKVDVNRANKNGYTSLCVAIERNHKEIVQILLNDNRVNVNIITRDNCTPLFIAVEKGHKEIVQILLSDNRVNVNIITRDNCTPLFIAVEKGHKEIITILLSNDKVYVNAVGRHGYTPLFAAAQKGNKEIVQIFLDDDRVDINANKDGYTPLHIALEYSYKEIFQILLESGADFNIKNKFGEAPINKYYISEFLTDCVKYSYTPLIKAIIDGRINIAKKLINEAEVNKHDTKDYTALLYAAGKGDIGLVKMLLDNAADPQFVNRDGVTCILIAAEKGNFDVVEELLKRGIEANTAPANNGSTPLYMAAQNGYIETVKLLCDWGADPNVPTKKGFTALWQACRKNYSEIVKILLEHKANMSFVSFEGSTPHQVAEKNNHTNIIKILDEHMGHVQIDHSLNLIGDELEGLTL